MVLLHVPLPPALVPVLLAEIAAGTEVLGSVAPPHPGSAVLDGAANSAGCGSAHARTCGPGCARRGCPEDHTAVPAVQWAEEFPPMSVGVRLVPSPQLPFLSRQAS